MLLCPWYAKTKKGAKEMDYFQARISRETAQHFQILKEIYEQENENSLTQANIISQALEDVSALNKWGKVVKINSINRQPKKEITDKDLRIRVQLSPQTQESIQNYKYYLPQFAGTRSITLGVTLKYIFKGAILVRSNPNFIDNSSKNIDGILDKYESRLIDLIAPINREFFESTFKELKNKILSKKDVEK